MTDAAAAAAPLPASTLSTSTTPSAGTTLPTTDLRRKLQWLIAIRAVISTVLLGGAMFAQITAEPSATFPGDHGDEPITNQDELLQRYPGAIGGKTGFTNAARKTFVGAAARGGRRLVIAMMYGLLKQGGPTYWDQAGSLFDWGFALNPETGVGSL